MRHKISIEVGEDMVTRMTVDGQPVGLIEKLEFAVASDDIMPKASITLLELDKHQQELITALKEIPWLKVDSHQ